MANEKLVSTVKYNGQSVGATELTIEDTSMYPTYSFQLINLNGNVVTDFQNALQLNNYILKFSQDTQSVGHAFLYATVKSPDGKFNVPADTVVGTATEKNLTLIINSDGTGSYFFSTMYFPSYLGYSAEVSFYYDAGRTMLIRTISISVAAIDYGDVEIIPTRNENLVSANATYPPSVQMGEKFSVRTSIYGPSIIGGTQDVSFVGTIGESAQNTFPNNPYMTIGSTMVMSVQKVSNVSTNPVTGSNQYDTLPNPAFEQPVLIKVRMGEAVSFNTLAVKNSIDGFAWYNETFGTLPLLRTGGTKSNFVFAIAQGDSVSSAPQNRLGPTVLTDGGRWDYINITPTVPNLGANNPTNYALPYYGQISGFSWKPAELNTLKSRRQFAKYQTSFTRNVSGAVSGSDKIVWTDISDPIANTEYGVVNDFIGSDLVVLLTPHARADTCEMVYGTTGLRDLYIKTRSFDGNGVQGAYNAPVSVLILRKSNMLNTYPDYIPYPRIIKADVVLGAVSDSEALWTITIPDGTGIDLREERYQIQHTTEQRSTQLNTSWVSSKVVREQSRLLIYGNFGSGTPGYKHYAIWDLGPNVKFGSGRNGKLFGNYADNISNWTTDPLKIGSTLSSTDVVKVLTVGNVLTGKFYGSANVTNNGLAKQYTIDSANTDGSAYLSSGIGILSWYKPELNTVDRRSQFVGYQDSGKLSKTSTQTVVSLNIENVQDPLSLVYNTPLNNFNFDDPLIFFSPNKKFDRLSTQWFGESIKVQVEVAGNLSTFVDDIDYLVLRKTAWASFEPQTPYPRILFADVIKTTTVNEAVNLPINAGAVPDPLNSRYQVLVQTKSSIDNVAAWCSGLNVKKEATRYVITQNSSNNIPTDLQIAVVDFGPPPEEIYGDEFIVTTERNDRLLTIIYIVASLYPVVTGNDPSKIYGSIRRGWSYFGNYFALFNQINVTNGNGGIGFIALDFTMENFNILDTTSTKPATIYLTISGNVKIQMNRETVRSASGSYQRYYVIPAHYSTMFNTMANTGSPAEKTYLVTLV